MTDYDVPRDHWGRPKLYTPDGGSRTGYTRVSTAAKWTDDSKGLINWTASQAMIGMIKSRPIQARVASLIASTKDDTYREHKTQLKDLVRNATQVAQSSGRADYGTAIHQFTELIDAGKMDWSYVPNSLMGPLEAYATAMQGVVVLDSEVFITVDEKVGGQDLHIAGSLDRVLDHPKYGFGSVVADLKTGKDEPSYPSGVTTQVAIYSRGSRYRDDVFLGTPVFKDGEPNADSSAWRKPLWPNLNQSVGLMIHLPLEPVRGKFVCNFYPLDLFKGWDNLELGVRVQNSRNLPKLKALK